VKKANIKKSPPSNTAGEGFQRLFSKPKVVQPEVPIPNATNQLSNNDVEIPKSLPGLSAEQVKRIEENRRCALERKQTRGGAVAVACGAVRSLTESNVSPTKLSTHSPATANVHESPSKVGDPNRVTTTPEKQSAATTPEKQPAALGPLVTPAKRETPKMALHQVGTDSPPVKATFLVGSKFDAAACSQWNQYSGLYKQRLEALRGSISAQARLLWSGDVPEQNFFHDMIGFKKGYCQQAVLIGVLIKELKCRPDVFKAYKQDVSAVGSLPEQATSTTSTLTSADDQLWLEDSTLRIKLDVDAGRIASLCSGLVVGVRGATTTKGEFKVTAICFPQTLLAQPVAPRDQNPQYLALLSDINIGGTESGPKLTEALLEFLTKQSMQERDRQLAACIQRVVICGGLFAGGNGAVWRPSRTALDEADQFLSQLSSGLRVDLMPGAHDPTNLSLPQKPFLPHLFSGARSQSNLRFVGNPFEANLDGFLILGHAGQPTEDILRCTNAADPLSALLMSLESLHLAPTAPETLAVPPLTTTDPFIIEAAPHMLFSGGHPKLQSEWRACAKSGSGTLCLCVPSFSTTSTIVLVNLCDPRDVRVHKFGEASNN